MDLRQIIREKHFEKNQVILLEDQTSRYMYIVYSGKVKAVQTSSSGKEKILAIHERGSYFGEMALLDGKTSPATVIAMEDTAVGLIGKEDFEERLLKNERAKREVISLLCARLREAWLMLKVFSFADAEQRIRAILNQISSHYGVKIEQGTIIRMNLTHQDIADCACVSRETASRILHRFSEAGEIENFGYKSVLLKPVFFEKMQIL